MTMTKEQLDRLAEERSSVAQDERGLSPEERELWQTAWVEGYHTGVDDR